jgi:hypothetical protein
MHDMLLCGCCLQPGTSCWAWPASSCNTCVAPAVLAVLACAVVVRRLVWQ